VEFTIIRQNQKKFKENYLTFITTLFTTMNFIKKQQQTKNKQRNFYLPFLYCENHNKQASRWNLASTKGITRTEQSNKQKHYL